ncbi:MAG: hypothetical protein SFV15_00525 [Polyangiaceae bacterium]|nr:hypothetical protein [Polyangiaceae bacterium]
MSFSLRLFFLLLSSWALVACSFLSGAVPAMRAKNPIRSAAAQLVWFEPEVRGAHAIGGEEVREVLVFPGEVVRFTTNRTLTLGERIGGGPDAAEIWSVHAPQQGRVLTRIGLFTTALLVKGNAWDHVHVGRAEDPGYAWFYWEKEVARWADGPFDSPFPRVASNARLNLAGFAALDTAIKGELADPPPKDALLAAQAIRRVAGLRAVRSIRPLAGFPYGSAEALTPIVSDGKIATRDINSRTFSALSSGTGFELTVEGPKLLHLVAFAARDTVDRTVSIRIEEHGRLRGLIASPVARERALETGLAPESGDSSPSTTIPTDLAVMRRIVTHVPPGTHRYRVRAFGGDAWVLPLAIVPNVHVEDALAGTFNEESLLDQAKPTCTELQAPGLCVMYLALTGNDEGKTWDRAATEASPAAVSVARTLARGGPLDPTLRYELLASSGDARALTALSEQMARDVDDTLRETWWRSTLRSTSWQGPPFIPDTNESWVTVLENGREPGCTPNPPNREGKALLELTEGEFHLTSIARTRFRELSLLVHASCTESGPIDLEVNGEKFSPNPSGRQVLWRMVVANEKVRVKVGKTPGVRLFASNPNNPCEQRFAQISPAIPTMKKNWLRFPPGEGAPGIEVWLHERTRFARLQARALEAKRTDSLNIVVTQGNGLTALDPEGTRWVRAARIPLPEWALSGIQLPPRADVAIRPIRRAPIEQKAELTAADLKIDEIIQLSRALRTASSKQKRGDLYAQRALLLAEAGARDAALADALAVKRLGSADQFGKDPVVAIHEAVQAIPPEPVTMSVKAYPLEADFDPDSQRCEPPTSSPRARLAALEKRLTKGNPSGQFDRKLAVEAAQIALLNPHDPRMPQLLQRSMLGSEWRAVNDLATANHRISKDRPPRPGAGESVKPWLLAGAPFEADYVTVSDSRPASAVLAHLGGANLTVHYVCIPRLPSLVRATGCPLSAAFSGASRHRLRVDKKGEGTFKLKNAELGSGKLTISVGKAPARWAAVVQLVFDRKVPGTREVKGLGWVLETPRLEYRHLVQPAVPLRVRLPVPGIVGIDIVGEGSREPTLMVTVDGKPQRVAVDGVRHIFPLAQSGDVQVRVRAGSATVALAQRVESPRVLTDRMLSASLSTLPGRTRRVTSPCKDDQSCWQDIAMQSDEPPSERSLDLGTVTSASGVVVGALPEDTRANDFRSTYLEQRLEYRRRVDAFDLWLRFGALGRVRLDSGPPSFGANALFYQDGDVIPFRFSGHGAIHFQRVEGRTASTFRPRAFVEYSWPVSSGLFLLPRIGYDGFYTSVTDRPSSVADVDDDVFSSYRFSRNTLLYVQTLGWWVPYFNNIYYLRPRATFNADAGCAFGKRACNVCLRQACVQQPWKRAGGLELQFGYRAEAAVCL